MRKLFTPSARNIFTLIFIITLINFGYTQNENRLIHPLFTDEFKSYFILPDETIRILVVSDQNNGYGGNHPIYVDIREGSLDSIAEPVSLEIPEHWFNSYVDNICSIGLRGGDVIIGNTQFDCDYPPPGGLMRLDKNGIILWYIDFIEQEIYNSPHELIFINTDAILIKDNGAPEESIVIDRNGHILAMSLPDSIYSHTIETASGFLASIDQRLDVLDSSFQVVLSYELENIIDEILVLGHDRYLIRTNNKSFILRDEGVLEELPLSPFQFKVIGYSDSYWALNYQGQIIRFDTFFMPLDTFELSPGVEPAICLPTSDGIVGISKYQNYKTLLFKGDEEEIDFSLPQDIGITGISMPDTVFFQGYHNYVWGIEFYIDSLSVEVTNFGEDTVSKFSVFLPSFWSCFWCDDHTTLWLIDSIMIPPGESRNVFLGTYYSDCIEGGGPTWKVCLSTIAPNDKADGNYLNDTICQRFSFLYTGTENIPPVNAVKIWPVPANYFIYIELDENVDQKLFGSIYDVNGKRLNYFEFRNNPEKVSVEDLDPGLYFLNIYSTRGLTTTKRFLVQH